MYRARQAVIAARKTIAEADRALKRFDTYFQSQCFDPDTLIRQLEERFGASVSREIDAAVAQVLQEIQQESHEAIQESRRSREIAPPRRSARQLI
jgi:hypothetical protein